MPIMRRVDRPAGHAATSWRTRTRGQNSVRLAELDGSEAPLPGRALGPPRSPADLHGSHTRSQSLGGAVCCTDADCCTPNVLPHAFTSACITSSGVNCYRYFHDSKLNQASHIEFMTLPVSYNRPTATCTPLYLECEHTNMRTFTPLRS